MFQKLAVSGGLIVIVSMLGACVPSADSAPTAAAITMPTISEPAEAAALAESDSGDDVIVVGEEGETSVDTRVLEVAVAEYSASGLTQEEMDGLIYMREEEKLAHDVYAVLFSQWQLPIFQNISGSEATHTNAVQILLDRYGLEDPTSGKAVGEFTNPTLQALYTQLVAQGSQSLGDALRVGAAIEEIDILDLETHLAQTSREDILLVYGNLEKGSRNHLRAFTSILERQTGEQYEPQYLSPQAYDAIINAPMERGRSD